MKTTIQPKYLLALLGAASLFAGTATSNAALYHVTVDTSSLAGNTALSLDFQFNEGSGPLGNNSATISNFSFGGGSATGSANLFNTTGSLLTGFTFDNAQVNQEAFQGFTAGSLLSFDVSISQNLNDGSSATRVPDAFLFTILDSDLNNIPVNGGNGTTLLEIDATPAGTTFLATGAGEFNAVTVSAVPEPSFALGGLFLVGLCGFHRASRRRVEPMLAA